MKTLRIKIFMTILILDDHRVDISSSPLSVILLYVVLSVSHSNHKSGLTAMSMIVFPDENTSLSGINYSVKLVMILKTDV
jgi:hypothetical protein